MSVRFVRNSTQRVFRETVIESSGALPLVGSKLTGIREHVNHLT